MGPLPAEVAAELQATATALVVRGKGILAADESTATIGKRFDAIGLENNEANRAKYREMLFSSAGLEKHISGVILYEETLYQKNAKGDMLVELLTKNGIIPGIKVDKGTVNICGTDSEKSTQGLDGLAERCAEYYKAGARFAKWRAVLSIDAAKGKPSDLSIMETAHSLARYASICQENKIVPIVEPEVLSDGSHSIELCAEVTEKVLAAVFKALHDHHVLLEGALLKPNMVTAGADCAKRASPSDVAKFTVRTLKRTVPPALPGVVFLSGGQSEEEASVNLNAMNAEHSVPYHLTFSFGRALQATCMKEWGGKCENAKKGQEALLKRCKANSEAQEGKYAPTSSDGSGSLYEKGYVY